MKKWLHKLEVIVDKSIPYLLLLLLVLILLEIFFKETAEHYALQIDIADYFIIFAFVIDLTFKYMRVKNIKKFIRHFWLDILAVFPFFLVFRVFEAIAGLVSTTISEGVASFQAILHESIEAERGGVKLVEKEGARALRVVEEEGAKIAARAERLGKVSRSSRFARFLRPILRFPRFLKAVPFYEKPTGHHHVRKKRKESK